MEQGPNFAHLVGCALVQESGSEFPPGMRSVLAKLLPLSSGAADVSGSAGKLHWRFVSLANTLLLLLLPPPTPHNAAQITSHFVSLLPSQLPAHRMISLAGLIYLFDLEIVKRLPVGPAPCPFARVRLAFCQFVMPWGKKCSSG